MPRRIYPHRISLTSLSCHPRLRWDIGFSLSLSLSFSFLLFTIFFASSYALSRRRVSSGRKFHPRIAQLIPRSCQPVRGTTTLRRCVFSKLDTYQSTTPRLLFIDWLISFFISFFSHRRRDEGIACSHYNFHSRLSRRNIFQGVNALSLNRGNCIIQNCMNNKSDSR